MRTQAIRSVAALALLTSGACGDASAVAQPSSPIAAVNVTPNAVALVVGEALRLDAALLDADGAPVGHRAVEWASEDATVAMVDADGRVIARGEGVARVQASSDGRSGYATIRVYAPGTIPPASALARRAR